MRLVEVAAATSVGGRLEMQDELLVAHEDERAVLAVADGHGVYGAAFARMACEGVRQALVPHLDEPVALLDRAIEARRALSNVHMDNINNYDYVHEGGGATATVLIVDGDAAATAQLGDSGAIYYPDGRVRGKVLTPLHDPSNRKEVRRVRKIGWKVHEDNEGVNRVGGMMITAAVGSYTEPFLRHDAEVGQHRLRKPGFLVVGTDGLFGISLANRVAVGRRLDYYRKGRLPLNAISSLLVRDFVGGEQADNSALIVARFE